MKPNEQFFLQRVAEKKHFYEKINNIKLNKTSRCDQISVNS